MSRVSGEPPGVREVRILLDTGRYRLEGAAAGDVASALWWYLLSLPEPLVPSKVAAQLSDLEPASPGLRHAAQDPDFLVSALRSSLAPLSWAMVLTAVQLATTALQQDDGRRQALTGALVQALFPAIPGLTDFGPLPSESLPWTEGEEEQAEALEGLNLEGTEEVEEGDEVLVSAQQQQLGPGSIFRRRASIVDALLAAALEGRM